MRAGGDGLRPARALFWPATDAAWTCCSGRASTARSAAPKAGLNRSDLGRHYNETISGGVFSRLPSATLARSPATAVRHRGTEVVRTSKRDHGRANDRVTPSGAEPGSLLGRPRVQRSSAKRFGADVSHRCQPAGSAWCGGSLRTYVLRRPLHASKGRSRHRLRPWGAGQAASKAAISTAADLRDTAAAGGVGASYGFQVSPVTSA